MDNRLVGLALPWAEKTLGAPLRRDIAWPNVNLVAKPAAWDGPGAPFIAYRTGMAVNVALREGWLARVEALCRDMHPDLLFSALGTYDLGRIMLPDGFGVWGPVPHYLADVAGWRPVEDDRPVRMSKEQLAAVDWRIFWHCSRKDQLAAFGVYEDGQLVALATVHDHGERIWEIGVDVVPDSTGRRLGSAVVSAAGDWRLENGGLIYATAAAWNVPSSRNLRALGMRYVFSTLKANPAPFRMPPQPLGSPLPGVELRDQYPRWSMNRDILPKEE
jgi:hypothetical protein